MTFNGLPLSAFEGFIAGWLILTLTPTPCLPKMSIVNLFVISPDVHAEKRYDLHTTIAQLKVVLTSD
jgi:hypothetical protein